MRRIFFSLTFSLFFLKALTPLFASPPISIPPVVPAGFGVNVHFSQPAPGEMQMLVDSDIKWLRVDFLWQYTEKEKGKYDFSIFEPLVKQAKENNIGLIFILAYGNTLYNDGGPPRSEETIQAFASWATAAAKHFQNHGILWEVWNEPSGDMFWPPKRNVGEYNKLALAVGKKFQTEVPGEILIGPALSRMDWDYLEANFKAGLLNYWSGVSVHPYRERLHPETFGRDVPRLKKLIARYAPAGKKIPIISGEWGYPSIEGDVDEQTQAAYLVRMYLTNLAQGIPLSIWYDWRDDGQDPKNREHHFGTVYQKFYPGRTPAFDPKPAFHAMKTLTHQLKGFRFSDRLPPKDDNDYILVFSKPSGSHTSEKRLVFWTSSPKKEIYKIALGKGMFQLLNMAGQEIKTWQHSGKRPARLVLKREPQYLIPLSGIISNYPSVVHITQ